MATGGVNLSTEFFELIKAIGESKSKQEEDRIIAKEVAKLKQKMETVPGSHNSNTQLLTSKKRAAKEFLVRLLYVEMLGHDGSFGYIKAVELAASSSLYHKRTGYLVCGACLPPDHEFRFMLVNQLQRDLHSANVLECSGGLLACTNIITADMVPAVATDVAKLLAHDSATIRKKTIVCLHKFHTLAPEVVTHEELYMHTRKALCDKDPSVMGSTLNVIYSLCLKNNDTQSNASNSVVAAYKDLVPSLVSILKQIADHRLPSDYDYHRVPAPWMQLRLVRILSLLGHADATASSGMYEILNDTMKKADATGINAGYAIVYECVQCIVHIYPNAALLNAAADAIARFMDSRSHNLKYLGVTGLALIVERQPQCAAHHQLAVMDCLEDPDETLQRKTLDLLYRMTNPVNVEFIAEKLVAFLVSPTASTDLFLKRQLTHRVCHIAERYAPNNAWYIRTITKLFEVAGDMVAPSTAQTLMSLIAEGTGGDDGGDNEEQDMLLRQTAVEIYVTLLRDTKKPLGSLPRILLETMAWCLGEYGYLSAATNLDTVLDNLCSLARTQKTKLAPSTRRFVVSAIMKLVAQAGTCPPAAAAVIDDYTRSQDMDLQQRCLEFQAILTNCPNLLSEIFPVDASAEDVDVDLNLSFLDSCVANALHNGARPYAKPEDDDDDDDYAGMMATVDTGFKMTPYDKPQTPGTVLHLGSSGIGSGHQRLPNTSGVALPPGAHGDAAPSTTVVQQHQHAGNATGGEVALNVRNVANVWGKPGVPASTPAAPPPPPPSTHQPPPSASHNWGTSASAESHGGYGGGYGTPSPAAPPPPPEKTAAQLERERQAAALFGGMVPGAPLPPPTQASAPVSAPPPPVVVEQPVAAPPVAAPAPSAAIDLLDMGFWDNSDSPADAGTAPVVNFDDTFSPQPVASSSGAQVENVDDNGEVDGVATTSAPASSALLNDDPFADAGLLGEFNDKPLPAFERSQKFEYNGTPMAPMAISTAQFGQQWGICKATASVSIQSNKVAGLGKFMELLAGAGAHNIEAIAVTNEGICSGNVGAHAIALIHGKVTPLGATTKLDVTVKGSDQAMCSALAMYLQTMLR